MSFPLIKRKRTLKKNRYGAKETMKLRTYLQFRRNLLYPFQGQFQSFFHSLPIISNRVTTSLTKTVVFYKIYALIPKKRKNSQTKRSKISTVLTQYKGLLSINSPLSAGRVREREKAARSTDRKARAETGIPAAPFLSKGYKLPQFL